MKSVNIFDHIVVGAYFLFMLGIGLYFMRFNKGAREYFAGGNMIPWWASGMTLYMANFTAWTFSGAAGFTYSTGPFMLIWFSIGSVAYFIGSFLTAKRWRRTRSISPVEYTHARYNTTTQQFLSWVIAINFTLSAGVQLAATSKLLSPVMNLDVNTMTLVTGGVILLYTFLGGVWAVSITDVVQGVILLGTTFIVAPLSLSLVGGVSGLFEQLPPLTFDHVYNGVHYDEHWLISILLISIIGFAAGSGQRFYSVKDEKSALRVGWLAALLGLAGPLTFGVPPLVARVLWPDLSQVDFFAPYLGSNPQDLVYLALCVKFLPNGLIGVFIAAMLAATMSTLSYVYNMVSSVFARDMYQGLFRPQTKDEELLKVGRTASVAIGLIVTTLALIFINSQFGIFNMMQVFFTLFNIPVTVPLCFGLIFRRVPKWSAVAGITWGLLAGIAGRYVLGWDIGPQVYLAFAMTFGIYATSYWTAKLYTSNKPVLLLISVLIAVGAGLLFTQTMVGAQTELSVGVAWLCAIAFGASLYGFAKLFTTDNEDDMRVLAEFFKKLDTPVDVNKEVFGAGKMQISAFPLVGGTMMVMGVLMSLVFLTGLRREEAIIVGIFVSFMILLGATLWYLGKRSEIRGPVPEAADADDRIHNPKQ
ncbi:MAG: hypothetical protein FJ217_02790 [Ignavibacteria bacterium]|nr:hypothetical protein [Ignavibacteria bacterium]